MLFWGIAWLREEDPCRLSCLLSFDDNGKGMSASHHADSQCPMCSVDEQLCKVGAAGGIVQGSVETAGSCPGQELAERSISRSEMCCLLFYFFFFVCFFLLFLPPLLLMPSVCNWFVGNCQHGRSLQLLDLKMSSLGGTAISFRGRKTQPPDIPRRGRLSPCCVVWQSPIFHPLLQ